MSPEMKLLCEEPQMESPMYRYLLISVSRNKGRRREENKKEGDEERKVARE
jgi:hypothetical protein